MDTQTLAAFSTSILAPILAYLKIQSDRKETANRRDTETELLKSRVSAVEKKTEEIDTIRASIYDIKQSVGKIETILEFMREKINKFTERAG